MEQQKIEFLNNLKRELERKNKFLDYLPKYDSIIINGRITIPFMEVKSYGDNVHEISRKIIEKTDDIFKGWMHIKNGTVPKECNINELVPILCSHEKMLYLTLALEQIKIYDQKKDMEEYYTPLITNSDQYKDLGIMFLYNLKTGNFPITLKQYEVLTNNMDLNEFMIKMKDNSRRLFLKEFNNRSSENGFVENFYLWNLKNTTTNSIILSIDSFFNELKEITKYYDEKMYLYPFSEKQFALFHGNMYGEDVIDTINVLNEINPKNNSKLFQITSTYTSTVEQIVQIIGPEAKA